MLNHSLDIFNIEEGHRILSGALLLSKDFGQSLFFP